MRRGRDRERRNGEHRKLRDAELQARERTQKALKTLISKRGGYVKEYSKVERFFKLYKKFKQLEKEIAAMGGIKGDGGLLDLFSLWRPKRFNKKEAALFDRKKKELMKYRSKLMKFDLFELSKILKEEERRMEEFFEQGFIDSDFFLDRIKDIRERINILKKISF